MLTSAKSTAREVFIGDGPSIWVFAVLFAILLGVGWLMNSINRGTTNNVILPYCGEQAVSSPLGQSMTNFRFPDCTVTQTDYGFPVVSKSVYVVTEVPKSEVTVAQEGDTIVRHHQRPKYRDVINPLITLLVGYAMYVIVKYAWRRVTTDHA